ARRPHEGDATSLNARGVHLRACPGWFSFLRGHFLHFGLAKHSVPCARLSSPFVSIHATLRSHSIARPSHTAFPQPALPAAPSAADRSAHADPVPPPRRPGNSKHRSAGA